MKQLTILIFTVLAGGLAYGNEVSVPTCAALAADLNIVTINARLSNSGWGKENCWEGDLVYVNTASSDYIMYPDEKYGASKCVVLVGDKTFTCHETH